MKNQDSNNPINGILILPGSAHCQGSQQPTSIPWLKRQLLELQKQLVGICRRPIWPVFILENFLPCHRPEYISDRAKCCLQ